MALGHHPIRVPSRHRHNILLPICGVVVIIIIWQFISSTKGTIPSPLEVSKVILSLLLSGKAVVDVLTSIKRVFIGFAIASILGISLGLAAGNFRSFSSIFTPIVELFRPIPPIAWIPIAILWFGIGDVPAYFIVFLGAFFPIFTNTLLGVQQVSRIHLDSALSLGASKSFILLEVTIPSALPYIMTGMRVGLGVGWICVITAELVGAQSGLGYSLQLSRIMLQMPGVIAYMVMIGATGYAMNGLMVFTERMISPWKT